MNAGRGRFLSELRRSNAAGIHAARPTRSSEKRLAIQEELDMSVLDGDYIPEWDEIEPTPEDLEEIESEEDYVPDDDREHPFDDEELYPYDDEEF